MEPDFSGYATKNDLKCSDGRTIKAGAFKHHDGQKLPLVWKHQTDEPSNILGHVKLEHREDGVYAYGFFNDTISGQDAKALVQHGDIDALSIYANALSERNKDVYHGNLVEVSLVPAGANPGARIDFVNIVHGDSVTTLDDEAVIYTGLTFEHKESGEIVGNKIKHEEGSDPTIQEVLDSMDDVQRSTTLALVGEALAAGSAKHSDDSNDPNNSLKHDDQRGNEMTRNVFDQQDEVKTGGSLTHAQLDAIVQEAKQSGSFKQAFLSHAVTYGIEDIDILFPDAKKLMDSPEFVSRRMEWVSTVMNGVKHAPFSRIKTLTADITLDTARAKGYVKGTMKKDEFFKLSQRVTTAKTIYKKQKLDRDDIIEITDLDVVAWLKAEMRIMLEEELARAILFGDGREVDDEDKIDEDHIRPIAYDDPFYAHPITMPSNVTAQDAVEHVLRSRKYYRGSGSATFFTTEDFLTDMLLAKDKMNRRLYESEAALAAALRVRNIVAVEAMESDSSIVGIMVNLSDYTVGTDRGGNISMFDDFDIDYNQFKYLIETRVSGALTKFKSALVFLRELGTLVTPAVPTFVPATGVVTIPSVTGVVYYDSADLLTPLVAGAQTAILAGATIEIEAVAADGYTFPHGIDTDWEFTRDL